MSPASGFDPTTFRREEACPCGGAVYRFRLSRAVAPRTRGFSKQRERQKMTRIAINGFGRIGRLVFRALYTQGLFGKDIEVVAVGDIVPADNLAYLLKYDSIQG